VAPVVAAQHAARRCHGLHCFRETTTRLRSTGKLLIGPGQSATGAADYNLILGAQQLTQTYAQLLKTRPVVEAAIRAGNLNLNSDQAAAMLEASPIRDTQLILVTSRAGDPELAATLPNLVVAALSQQTEASQSSRFAATEGALREQLDQVTPEISSHMAQIDVLRSQPATPDSDNSLTRLRFELTQLQQTYDSATRSYQDIRLAAARSSNLITLAEPASPPTTAAQPRILLNVLEAAALGLLGMIGLTVLVEAVDDRLTSSERLTTFTGLNTLGAIELRPKNVPAAFDQLAPVGGTSVARPHAARFGEAFRLLSTNLQFAAVDRQLSTLLITSSGPGDGKTTVATNLAIVMAQAGKRVVLIDADLRHPELDELFQVPNRSGLTSLLINDQLPAAGEVLPTRVPGLSVLTSGPLPPNPSELLASQRMLRRLAEVSELADLVLVDSAPVLQGSDAVVLARIVDGVLLVAHAKRTRGQYAAQATAILRNAGARIVGAVLNAVPRTVAAYYDYPDSRAKRELAPRTTS